MEEKFKALISDEEFVTKLGNCKDTKEISALFAENGIDISAEQLDEAAAETGKELSPEELEGVAGGNVAIVIKAVTMGIKYGLFFFDKLFRK